MATYTDSLGDERMARAVSAHMVRAEVSSDSDGVANPANGSPGFSSQNDYTRTVSESLGTGMDVGDPVEATDPNLDTLTYELDDNITTGVGDTATPTDHDVTYFSINEATGQLMVKETLDYDMKGTGADQGKYKFYVRAIDPSGETVEVEVTVTVTDANDAPKIMGSRTTTEIGGALTYPPLRRSFGSWSRTATTATAMIRLTPSMTAVPTWLCRAFWVTGTSSPRPTTTSEARLLGLSGETTRTTSSSVPPVSPAPTSRSRSGSRTRRTTRCRRTPTGTAYTR